MWDEEDPYLYGVNIGESERDTLNEGLENAKISVLQDKKHDGSAVVNRVMRRRSMCLMKDDGSLGKKRKKKHV